MLTLTRNGPFVCKVPDDIFHFPDYLSNVTKQLRFMPGAMPIYYFKFQQLYLYAALAGLTDLKPFSLLLHHYRFLQQSCNSCKMRKEKGRGVIG